MNDIENKSGNYYYIRIKENFFNTEKMLLLESLPDGILYSNILLKLYLRSLKDEGRLMFNNLIPYNSQMLATLVNHSVGNVEKALEIFKQLELIDILDNGAIYMMDIQDLIGKSSNEADRKKKYRNRIEQEKRKKLEAKKLALDLFSNNDEGQISGQMSQNNEGQMSGQMSHNDEGQMSGQMSQNNEGQMSDKCPPQKNVENSTDYFQMGQMSDKCPTELELELDKELELGNVQNEKDVYGTFHNVNLTKTEYEILKKQFVNVDGLINHISDRIHTYGYKMASDYKFAMKCGKEDNWETVAECIEKENNKKRSVDKQDEIAKRMEEEKALEIEDWYNEKMQEYGVASHKEVDEILEKNLGFKIPLSLKNYDK